MNFTYIYYWIQVIFGSIYKEKIKSSEWYHIIIKKYELEYILGYKSTGRIYIKINFIVD